MTFRDPLESVQIAHTGAVPKVDLHMHTTWTDGANSVDEMHACAVTEGLELINFSEHARRTSGDWFPRFAEEVRALPKDRCVALVGVETKVADFEGNLDITSEISDLCDLVMASVHRFPSDTEATVGTRNMHDDVAIDTEFRLMNAVLDNPAVNILGHPFGMSYRRFGAIPPDQKICAVIEKAAKTGVAFEINARYHPDPWRLIKLCGKAGARISLGSNAHRVGEVGQIVRVLQGKEPPWNPSGSL